MPELKQTDLVELFGGRFDGAFFYRQNIRGLFGEGFFPIEIRKGIEKGYNSVGEQVIVETQVVAIYKLNGNRAEFQGISLNW